MRPSTILCIFIAMIYVAGDFLPFIAPMGFLFLFLYVWETRIPQSIKARYR